MGTPSDSDTATDIAAVEVTEEPNEAPAATGPPTRPTPPPVPIVAAPSGPTARSSSRSIPPPIPTGERRRRTTLAMNAVEMPTAVDKAVAERGAIDDRMRGEVSERALAVVTSSDPVQAAMLAYELGEHYERKLGDEERAIQAYRRAFELDPSLRPNRWSLRRVLYRRSLWAELQRVLDRELADAADDHEKVEWLLERAVVAGHANNHGLAKTALDEGVALAPDHQGVNLELERIAARGKDVPGLLDAWQRLGDAVEAPGRKLGYWLAVAHEAASRDYARAQKAIEQAAELAASAPEVAGHGERIARERLRLADLHGVPDDVANALELLASGLGTGVELAAIRRRQAQLARTSAPSRAWEYLQLALAAAPDEPLIVIDLIEVTAELGRHGELPALVKRWHALEPAPSRALVISAWTAEAHAQPATRVRLRGLVAVADEAGSLLATSTAECEAIAALPASEAMLALAATYTAAAPAAVDGTWPGPRLAAKPEREAGAALYVQAAHVLAYEVATPEAIDEARAALAKALEAVPGYAAALEARIELDDATGNPDAALEHLRALGSAEPGNRALVERALRIAHGHGRTEAALELERQLARTEPKNFALQWRLEATLARLELDDERAELLAKLATDDPDSGRRRTAMLDAARLHERGGATHAAVDLYRLVRAQNPEDNFARDALVSLLRESQRWAELVIERRAEARGSTDDRLVRRALREAAWVLELWLDDIAQAASVYDEWLARLPGDRTALEGIARCRSALRDHGREATARETIAEVEQSGEGDWLYARSLERAGRHDEAAARYREVLAREDSPLAATTSALALATLAARNNDVAMQIEADEALARRTIDPRLGAALFEDSGWLQIIAQGDFEAAGRAFAASLALEPPRQGALFGAGIAAARRGDKIAHGKAYVDLASTLTTKEAAVTLYLRGAALAQSAGNSELAAGRVEDARELAPDSVDAMFVAAELGVAPAGDPNDPFAAGDRLVARAELLEQRAKLVDDVAVRAHWDLDRAEALEQAGQLREAAAVLAQVLAQRPDDTRAITAVRRVAHRVADYAVLAQASHALAQLARDRESKLKLWREAAEIYDRSGIASDRGLAIAMYTKIVAVDPNAPELERMFELVREGDDVYQLVAMLTERLTRLAAVMPQDDSKMVPHLLERSTLLRGLGRRDLAIADLDAVLAFAPREVEALRLRADLAHEAGDTEAAVALWWRYLAVETAATRRAEVEQLMAQVIDKPKPPPLPLPTQTGEPGPARGPFSDQETTAADGVAAAGKRIAKIRKAQPDPFGNTTLVANMAILADEERREAKVRGTTQDATGTDTNAAEDAGDGTLDTGISVAAPPHPASLRTQPAMPIATEPPAVSVDTAIGAAVGAFDPETGARIPYVLRPPALDLRALREGSGAFREPPEPKLAAGSMRFPEQRPMTADDSAVVMLSYADLQPAKSQESTEEALAHCERELAIPGETARAAALRLDAGRLAEALGHAEKARAHYDAAFAADPRSGAALRGLRRLARARNEHAEVARLAAAEHAIASPREREVMLRYRLDLLLANGEREAARSVMNELLVKRSGDLSALLANAELAFLDDRREEREKALDQLVAAFARVAARSIEALAATEPIIVRGAPTVVEERPPALPDSGPAEPREVVISDGPLRAALCSARAVSLARRGERATSAAAFTAAAELSPGSAATHLAAIRETHARGRAEPAGAALLELAYHVEGEDPATAAALAVRSQHALAVAKPQTDSTREAITNAAQLAARAAPRDPLVARVISESAHVTGDHTIASHAFSRWARDKCPNVERAYAAARAAELEPARLGRLWAQVLELDPGDDYATARLRAAHVAAGEVRAVIELDLQTARDSHRDAALVRAASELVAQDSVGEAIELLAGARAERQTAPIIAELLAEAHAAAGNWPQRAQMLAELAAAQTGGAREIGRLRAALAWDHAARKAVAAGAADAERIAIDALDAWDLVLADDARATIAHACSLALATQLRDPTRRIAALAKARAVERSPWAASSLGLRRARLIGLTDPKAALAAAREHTPGLDDPRRALVSLLAAARAKDLGEAARALEDRAAQIEPLRRTSNEPTMLRTRAAQLALDGNDDARAASLLSRVDEALPGLAGDLYDAARRRTGATPPPRTYAPPSFTRLVREADAAEPAAAVDLYQRALDLRAADPFVAAPLAKLAYARRDAEAATALALQRQRRADHAKDAAGKADAFAELAHIDRELRGDPVAAQQALENAVAADPSRVDLLHRLEREPAAHDRFAQLVALREKQLPLADGGAVRDVVALAMDTATLAVRDRRSDGRIEKLYRATLAVDPFYLRALFHLEAILLRANHTAELATLEEHIAGGTSDPRTHAAFLTRAGEALAKLGKPAEAVQRFARASDVLPGYTSALEAWHQTALAAELWLELAEAVTRKARLGGDPNTVAGLYHLAGVSLMDKAKAPELAVVALRGALAADPAHLDTFVRLRRLLEDHGTPDELGKLVLDRLEVETDAGARVELNRALAEHFAAAGERDRALSHYRALLKLEPADVRSHAAIADLASEHGSWQQAADAITARIALEKDAKILRALHFRLGNLLADQDPVQAMAEFQKAIALKRDDKPALARLVDVAIAQREWQTAMDACNVLVSTEKDPSKLSAHLQRAAAIFAHGFDDRERAERMLELALENAPTSTEALRQLVQLFDESGAPDAADKLRGHLDHVAETMRPRLAREPRDGGTYRMLARTRAALAEHGVPAARAPAFFAAELAESLGAAGDVEQRLLADAPLPELARFAGPHADDALAANLPRPELLQFLRVLAAPLAKYLGSDLATYGVGRKDRLKPVDASFAIAKDLAMVLGFKDVEVYVSSRRPFAMAAEPGTTPALVLGSSVISGDPRGVRFAAGAALKLAQLGLAVPARLTPDDLATVVLALLRLFKPDASNPGVNPELVAGHVSKLRKIVAADLVEEARPLVRTVDHFDPHGLARELKIIGLRAGLAASGTLRPGLGLLASAAGTDIAGVVGDAVIQGMVMYALYAPQ